MKWENDNVIYPDKVRINLYYLDHYSFIKDIQMIFCTVLGKKMEYGGEALFIKDLVSLAKPVP
jgi:lipopolysaccharide/colanic/teichoic acid biosynthesis glycosyltransferase